LQLHCLETGEKHAGKSNASPRPTIAMDRKFSPEFSAIGRTDDGGCTILPSALEHFRAKWMPVRVKKMRQNKNHLIEAAPILITRVTPPEWNTR
jgi:hypothetical protein